MAYADFTDKKNWNKNRACTLVFTEKLHTRGLLPHCFLPGEQAEKLRTLCRYYFKIIDQKAKAGGYHLEHGDQETALSSES